MTRQGRSLGTALFLLSEFKGLYAYDAGRNRWTAVRFLVQTILQGHQLMFGLKRDIMEELVWIFGENGNIGSTGSYLD